MDQVTFKKEERRFAQLHAQDGSPRQLIRDRTKNLKEMGIGKEEVFTNVKKDYSKHFTDEEIINFINE